MIHEGTRGIIAPYMRSLGASPEIVGITTGLANILSYSARLPAGVLADLLGNYWLLTFFSYRFLIAIPLMGLSNNWGFITFLYLLERIGKGLRTPFASEWSFRVFYGHVGCHRSGSSLLS